MKIADAKIVGLAALVGLSACGRHEEGTPKPGEGAVAYVQQPGAGAAQNPTPAYAENGGPAGQTPAWGKPGGAAAERVVGPSGDQGTLKPGGSASGGAASQKP